MKGTVQLLWIIPALLCISMTGSAQLCQGSLGDPVINITFGAGQNPGSPLPSAGTSYIFNSTTCPNDGFYTVANSSTACFSDSWHTVSQDHTPNDALGYFMLVNASFAPGDFYVETVRGLCPNTTFEFAAWIMNVLKTTACAPNGIDPDLTFTIETTAGAILQTYNTGKIVEDASPTWRQYGFFFKTPEGVNDVVVRIRNNAGGGCGNDLALDDITFRPCGPGVTATISGAGTADVKDVCDDDLSVYLLSGSISSGYDNPAYQWQESNDQNNWTDIAGATTTTYARQPTPAGTYYYRLATAEQGNINSPNCRIVSNTITFNVLGKPVPNATATSPICEGTDLSLTATNGATYAWTGPGNFTATGSPAIVPAIGLNSTGRYYVLVTSSVGCTQTDSVDVTVIPKPIANAGADAGICEGGSISLNATGGGSYSWQPATGLSNSSIANPVASPTDSTIYVLTVTDNNNCSDADSISIFVHRLPTANAGPDKAIIQGDAVQLLASAGGTAVTFNWQPNAFINSNTILQPVVTPPGDTTYTLSVNSQVGCGTATDAVFIKVFTKVTVPNAFSPNLDGINDTWRIDGIEAYPDADVRVFNRYGQAVFSTKSSSKYWDGKYNNTDLPVGTYYYIIDLKYGLPQLKGWVAVLR